MLDDLFKKYNCSITRAGGPNTSICSYRIKCANPLIDSSFYWSTADKLESFLKDNPILVEVCNFVLK